MDVEELTGTLWQLDDASALREFLAEEVEFRRSCARRLARLADLDSRGVAAGLGYGKLAFLLRDSAHIDTAAANRLLAQAGALHASNGVSGEPVPARLPIAAEALAAGEITTGHVRRIEQFRASLPADVPEAAWEAAEACLVSTAGECAPAGLAKPIAELRAHLDPDGSLPDEAALAEPDRELHLHWSLDHGRLNLRGYLDPEAGKRLEETLAPLAEKRLRDPADPAGTDVRPVAARYGDALADLLEVGLAEPDTPGGASAQLTVTIDYDSLRTGLGSATLDDGARISAAQARKMACNAALLPVTFDSGGRVLDMATSARLATTTHRRILAARDGGCSFPHCTRPPSQCQAHHIEHHVDGGATSVDNMALLCPHHHRLLHHSGWEVRMAGGHPEFHPPDYITLRPENLHHGWWRKPRRARGAPRRTPSPCRQ
jgi:hypothetical protein